MQKQERVGRRRRKKKEEKSVREKEAERIHVRETQSNQYSRGGEEKEKEDGMG
jgi:hypothetical protein